MQQLESLTREAQNLAGASEHSVAWHKKGITENEAELARQMQICNACRYCEGFCAVFPAMTLRLQFDNKADLNYLLERTRGIRQFNKNKAL
jgi:citrate/tricarballylate utilization protein